MVSWGGTFPASRARFLEGSFELHHVAPGKLGSVVFDAIVLKLVEDKIPTEKDIFGGARC